MIKTSKNKIKIYCFISLFSMMRGKNVLTPLDKLKGCVLLYFIMSVVPSLEYKSSLEFIFVGYASILPINLEVPWVAYA